MEVFKTVSHYLWFSVVLSNVQNVPIIMSEIVWKKLNPDFRLFGDIFWSILTIIRVKNEIFYHLGKKKSKKVNFELETATFKIDQKWCLEKVQFSPIKSSKVDFFWIQRRITKFSFYYCWLEGNEIKEFLYYEFFVLHH